MTKIIVTELPKSSNDCPFSIPDNGHEPYKLPAVCSLKFNKTYNCRNGSGVVFSGKQKENCSLCENRACEMLCEAKSCSGEHILS